MFASILYLLSVIFVLIVAFRFPKSIERLNVVIWVPVLIICYMSYVALISGLFSLIHIPVSIITIAICNFIIGGILQYFALSKNGRSQTHYIIKGEVIFMISLLATVVAVCLFRYFAKEPLIYSTSDPAVHLSLSKAIIELKTVIVASPDMYFAWINNALFMEFLNPIWSGVMSFRSFQLMDIINMWLAGSLFYAAVMPYLKTKFTKGVAYLVTFVYLFGYPWNNELAGYYYLGLAVSLVIVIQISMTLYRTESFKSNVALFILSLSLFGLGVCYTIFVPPVFIAVFGVIVFFALNEKKRGDRLTKKTIIGITKSEILIFAIPTAMTFVFTVLLNKTVVYGESLGWEGGIHKQLFLEFLPYLPFCLFIIVQSLRKRNFSFQIVFPVILIIWMAVFFALALTGHVSSYYYYKHNFLLWFVVLFLTVLAVEELITAYKLKAFIVSIMLCWGAVAVFAVSGLDTRIYEKVPYLNPDPASSSFFQVYRYNIAYLRKPELTQMMFSWDFVDLNKEALRIKQSLGLRKDSVTMIADQYEDQYWSDALVSEDMGYIRSIDDEDPASVIWIVDRNSQLYAGSKELIDGYEKVYENDSGFIVLLPEARSAK